MPDVEMSDNENATQFEDSNSDYNPFAYSHTPLFVYHDAPSDTDSDNEDTNSRVATHPTHKHCKLMGETKKLERRQQSRVYSPMHG
jgi:hypothetical protein